MDMYLAIDLGTTGCRSILFDGKLNLLSDSYREYPLDTPKEKWAQQDANLWWMLTLETAKDAICKSQMDAKAIRAISISSQGITIVPVDESITPLCPAQTWLDMRAEAQAARLETEWGTRASFTNTGKRIKASYTLPKLMWLQEEMPDIYAAAWKYLMPMDFLLAKFTGKCVTDHSMASGTLMYDIKNQCWDAKILETYHIPMEKLPTLMWSGQAAGKVLPEVAMELGLSPDCVVAVGAQDQKCAALGVGLGEESMTLSLGTSGAIEKLWHEPKTEGPTAIPWSSYTQKGSWVTEAVINTAGTCLRWVRDLMFPGESYETINREAAESNRKLLFYPYMNGPTCPDFYPDSAGCFYGANLATRRGDFASAVMDGIAYQVRILLEAMDAYASVKTLVLFGGGAKSPLWCQKIADITGKEIRVPTTAEAAGAGAAMLAAQAVGEEMAPLETAKRYFPILSEEEREAKYRQYRKVEKKLWAKEDSDAAN